jgi:hypothetical protein
LQHSIFKGQSKIGGFKRKKHENGSRGNGLGAEFPEEFKRKFIPRWVLECKEDEFQSFKQEGRTVVKYTFEFTRLSKYCPLLVQMEFDRTRRFMKGIRSELR